MAAVAPSACIADITIAVWLFIADITVGAWLFAVVVGDGDIGTVFRPATSLSRFRRSA